MVVLFVCTLEQAWGGSELLWSQTALEMAKRGHAVTVSIDYRPVEPSIISQIDAAGGTVLRHGQPATKLPPAPILKRFMRRMIRESRKCLEAFKDNRNGISLEERVLSQAKPDLVVISQGTCTEGISWMGACQRLQARYMTVSQAAHAGLFYADEFADRIEPFIRGALCNYFVSRENQHFLENFLGGPLRNPAIIRNPFQVDWEQSPAWPTSEHLHLAVVGRLDTSAKGQELLLQLLASQKWRERDLRVHFYGCGNNGARLRLLAKNLQLEGVCFYGHVGNVNRVWQESHLCVLPSRCEGLPIALVEAMLCGRPAIATDVGGNAELVVEGITGFLADAPTVRSLDAAFERMWKQRANLREMGKRAAERVRMLIPRDPAAEFANCLERCGNAATTESESARENRDEF